MNNPNVLLPVLASAELRPANEGIYPAWSALPRDSLDLPRYGRRIEEPAYKAALAYVRTVLPDLELEPLSNVGTTAVVLHDGTYAYKVFRERSRGYDRVEKEAAALEVLGQEGISPRPVALIDAARRHRYANPYLRDSGPVFGGKVDIPRVESSGHLPILVTELQDVGPIAELPTEQLTTEFDRFALTALRHGLKFEDCKFLYDRRANRAIIVDVGEVHHPTEYSGDEEGENMLNGELVQRVLVGLCKSLYWPPVASVAPGAYPDPDKLATLHPILHEYRRLT